MIVVLEIIIYLSLPAFSLSSRFLSHSLSCCCLSATIVRSFIHSFSHSFFLSLLLCFCLYFALFAICIASYLPICRTLHTHTGDPLARIPAYRRTGTEHLARQAGEKQAGPFVNPSCVRLCSISPTVEVPKSASLFPRQGGEEAEQRNTVEKDPERSDRQGKKKKRKEGQKEKTKKNTFFF